MASDDDKVKKGQRTDFLGALKESTSNAQDATKDATKEDQLAATFDDGQSSNLIQSALTDVTHPVSFSNATLSEPSKANERDSLSQLLEEITDATASDQPNPQGVQETK